MNSTAVLKNPTAPATQEQESSLLTGIALALAGALFVLAVGLLVSGILGWHTLPFTSPQVAKAYYLDLEDVLRPQLEHAPGAAPQHH